MTKQWERTARLMGEEAVERLAKKRVIVFGLGGVGGYAAEALARSGIGALDLVDHDTVSLSNLNRQILALHSTLGRYKTDVCAERIADISPECVVRTYRTFFTPETKGEFDFTQYDYVLDAIDTVAGKLAIIECARDAGVPVISAMGAGGKLDPTLFRVTDISKTCGCPLARVMRRECRRRGIDRLTAVWSPEEPAAAPAAEDGRRAVPGSAAFVPSVAGLIMAGEAVRQLASAGPR